MMLTTKRMALTIAAASLTVALGQPVAHGVVTGNQGCTPGYWKNHTENWFEGPNNTGPISTSTTIESVFNGFPASNPYYDTTLLQALQLKGGPGIDGATRILLRAAAAAYLNAAHEGLGYPYAREFGRVGGYTGGIEGAVRQALASGDRAAILRLARLLDEANNLGCPLN